VTGHWWYETPTVAMVRPMAVFVRALAAVIRVGSMFILDSSCVHVAGRAQSVQGGEAGIIGVQCVESLSWVSGLRVWLRMGA
jgi:hypothetical protein